ncbi:hypothetical protein RIEGSTA812A_PEG_530 [invertebrate metagenome]|uniref:Uncharacterized protein n=1 Tax=invertebrate metagenome TaxID=1711999 RepID=A0A484H561_9ZZZZ
MPTTPYTFPARAASGLDNPRNAMMKQTEATRYASVVTEAAVIRPPLLAFLLEHR